MDERALFSRPATVKAEGTPMPPMTGEQIVDAEDLMRRRKDDGTVAADKPTM